MRTHSHRTQFIVPNDKLGPQLSEIYLASQFKIEQEASALTILQSKMVEKYQQNRSIFCLQNNDYNCSQAIK